MIRSVICGYGAALPKKAMANSEIEGIVETSDEWIAQRTGIRQRYIADETETTAYTNSSWCEIQDERKDSG